MSSLLRTRAYTFLALWAITWLSVLGGGLMWLIYWCDLKTNDKYWWEIIPSYLVVGYGLGKRDFSAEELANFTATLTATAQDEADTAYLEEYKTNQTEAGVNVSMLIDTVELNTTAQIQALNLTAPAVDPVIPHRTVHLPVDGYTIYMILTVALPFFLMGLTALLASTFPSHAAFSPKVSKAKRSVRAFMSRPLPPIGFLRSWINGFSLAEFVLMFWVIAPQVWWTVEMFSEARKEWNAGEITELGVFEENFTKHQFWIEEVSLWPSVLFLIQVPFLLIPVARGSLLNTFLGVPYAQAIKFHRWVGTQVVVSIIWHGLGYQILWLTGKGGRPWVTELWKWKYSEFYGVSNLAGLISWVACIVMTVTLLPYIRRTFYHIFYYAHVVGAVVFVIFGCLHLDLTNYFIFGVMMWGIDAVYRWAQTSHTVLVSSNLSGEAAMITLVIPIKDGLEYKDGCHVWICVPELARLEYHPFSVALSQADPACSSHIVVYCKVYNRWTKKLAELAGSKAQLTAKVQGPFDGHELPAEEQEQYDRMVFFAGGVGITGVLSTVQRLLIERRDVSQHGKQGNLPRLSFVMVARHASDLQLLASLLPYTDLIDIHVHYTGDSNLQPGALQPLHAFPDIENDSSSAFKNGVSARGSKQGMKGSDDGSAMGTSPGALRKPVASTLELATVWVIASFAAAWVMITAGAWVQRKDIYQLGITEPKYQLSTYWSIALQFAVAVLLPAAIVFIWRSVAKGTPNVEVSPPLLSTDVVSVAVDSNGNATIGLTRDPSSAVQVHRGRPNILDLVAGFREDQSMISIWVAGPKPFNNAVYTAIYSKKWGAGVHFKQLAYEL